MQDYSRKFDLEMLYEDLKKVRSSSEKEKIEKIMFDIVEADPKTIKLRGELIQAIRHDDRNHIKRCQQELRHVQAEKYNNNIQL